MEEYNIEDCVDLDSCIKWIEDHSQADPKDSFSDWIKLDEDSALSQSHHGFGTWLRNTLGLWHDGPPVKYFNDLGIYHADDMSGIILTSLHRKFNNKDINLDEQVKHYIEYWEKVDPNVNKGMK